ncbi:MAG: cell wall hydrolase [Bacillota bacterium]
MAFYFANVAVRLKKSVLDLSGRIRSIIKRDKCCGKRLDGSITLKAKKSMLVFVLAAALAALPAQTGPIPEEGGEGSVNSQTSSVERETHGGYRSGSDVVSRGRINRNDRYLMARVIEGEAGGETLEGKVAVGAVILNRTRSGDFPGDVRGVVYQPYAFEAVANGQYTRPVSTESLRAADMAMDGWDPTGGALYYWNPATASSKWVWQRPVTMKIGRHVFAK